MNIKIKNRKILYKIKATKEFVKNWKIMEIKIF